MKNLLSWRTKYHDRLSQLYLVWPLVKVLVKVPEVLHAVGLLQVDVSLKLHTLHCIGDSCGGGDEDGGGEEIERVMMEMVGISVNPLRAEYLFYTKTLSAELNFTREKDINWHGKF